MRRREFITIVGSAAAAGATGARAQINVHRIGALLLGIADADSFKAELREGLRSSGVNG